MKKILVYRDYEGFKIYRHGMRGGTELYSATHSQSGIELTSCMSGAAGKKHLREMINEHLKEYPRSHKRSFGFVKAEPVMADAWYEGD